MSASNRGARGHAGLIALLAGCSALGPMANMMLLPALPQIQRDFAVSTAAVQTIISGFLIAFATAILFVGPLSDRYGRRPVLLGGMAMFLVGTLVCALAPNLGALLFGRVLQAIGGACCLTIARAVAGDRFHNSDLAQMLAIITMAMMLGTTVSPAFAGYLNGWFGWHSTFWFLLGLTACVMTSSYFLLPETRQFGAQAESTAALIAAAGRVVRNPLFTGYVLQAGGIYAIYLAFIAVSPHIMADALGRPDTDFGFYYMLLSAGYFIGNLFVSTRGRRLNPERLMVVGLVLQALGAALGFAFAWFEQWSPATLFWPQLPVALGQGLALPYITARAVQLAPGYSGVASSMIGFGQQVIAALAVQLMGLASTATPVPICLFCLLAAIAALLSLVLLQRRAPS